MTIGNWLTLIGLVFTFLVTLGGIVRWALRAEMNATLSPLQSKLEALSIAATQLATEMRDAKVAHKEERSELHDGLVKLREFLEKLDQRVDDHGERLAVIEAMREKPTPSRKPRITARK